MRSKARGRRAHGWAMLLEGMFVVMNRLCGIYTMLHVVRMGCFGLEWFVMVNAEAVADNLG